MLWILFVLAGMAQDSSKGKIVDADTNEGIPYATIAFVGTADGVVSDHQGYFPIVMTKMFDSVRISAVGYKPIAIATADLTDPFIVPLEKEHFALDEVVVKPSDNCNAVKIGNFGKRRGSSDGLPFPGFEGYQKALLVLPPDTLRTYTVNKAMVFLTGKTNWGFPFRLRIYEYDTSTGLPGRDLTAESIIVTPEEKKPLLAGVFGGWVAIDLEEYSVVLPPEGVVVGFDWIQFDDGEGPVLGLSVERVPVYSSFLRRLDQWHKHQTGMDNLFLTPMIRVEAGYCD